MTVWSEEDACNLAGVLQAVAQRRIEQVQRYGHNDDLQDGTGPEAEWLDAVVDVAHLGPFDATEIEELLRQEYVKYERDHGSPTWMHLVREEVAEAFMENAPAKLEDELLDVAALCVSWVETLRRRGLRSSPPAR